MCQLQGLAVSHPWCRKVPCQLGELGISPLTSHGIVFLPTEMPLSLITAARSPAGTWLASTGDTTAAPAAPRRAHGAQTSPAAGLSLPSCRDPGGEQGLILLGSPI